jgi:hypothetical protein
MAVNSAPTGGLTTVAPKGTTIVGFACEALNVTVVDSSAKLLLQNPMAANEVSEEKNSLLKFHFICVPLVDVKCGG